MGQKTHPTGFRIGIIEPWVSTWFAKKKQYAANIAEDAKIRRFVKKKLYTAALNSSIPCPPLPTTIPGFAVTTVILIF